MIGVLAPQTYKHASHLVLAALRRSVTYAQARLISLVSLESKSPQIVLAINPTEAFGEQLLNWLNKGRRKLIIFGEVPTCLVHKLDFERVDWPADSANWSSSEPAAIYEFSESLGVIQYGEYAHALGGSAWRRPMERFDFMAEWNNLGYGAIRMDGSIWSLAAPLKTPLKNELASLCVGGEAAVSYAALVDSKDTSVLWFNRAVGPIDSFEWRLVEEFIANFRYQELPCYPVVLEIPWGHDAAVTMRLDCDEDVESARPLWDCYCKLDVPFSLAVHTSNLSDESHHPILRELVEGCGSILSHTATHAPNWGGSYQAAFIEGCSSKKSLEEVTGVKIKYAVSPFHQTPMYALEGLADAGYRGCIGGIICNDPEFLISRGGELAYMPSGFIGHSQQVMLHGDCLISQGDALSVYKEAFRLVRETKSLFGYLDHPFSSRYQYGWLDEKSRIDAHVALIAYIRSQAVNPLFLSQNDAMDFIYSKTEIVVTGDHGKFRIQTALSSSALRPTIEFKKQFFEASCGLELQ